MIVKFIIKLIFFQIYILTSYKYAKPIRESEKERHLRNLMEQFFLEHLK